MRGTKYGFILICFLFLLHSCGKNNVPQQESPKASNALTFTLKIQKEMVEPTIINGYYGRLLTARDKKRKENDSTSVEGLPSRNLIYIYEAEALPALNNAAFQKNGKTFYDFKKAEDNENVRPRYIIKPNKQGFYQVDTDSKIYYLLIATDKSTGYYPTGPLKLGSEEQRLIALDLILKDF